MRRSKWLHPAGATPAEDYSLDSHGSMIVNYIWQDWIFNLSVFWRDAISVLKASDAFFLFNAANNWRPLVHVDEQCRVLNKVDQEYSTPVRGSGLGRDCDGQQMRDLPQRGRDMQLGLT